MIQLHKLSQNIIQIAANPNMEPQIMSYDLELLFLSALPINIYIFIQIIYLTNNSLGRYFLREIDI